MRVLAAVLPMVLALPAPGREVVIDGRTMGTAFRVVAEVVPDTPTDDGLARGIEGVLEAVDRRFSGWRADSDVSRFNDAPGTDWVPVPADVVTLLDVAREVHALCDGALDPTVAPLVLAWGFGPGGAGAAPDAAALAEARSRVGLDLVESRHEPPALRRTRAGVTLDFSAIAKGHGADRVAAFLGRAGVAAYLVDIGGELRVGRARVAGMPWRVAVEHPAGGASVVLALVDAGVATSGTYRNRRVVDGASVSHVVDPRSGRPLAGEPVAVTVVAADAARADALATGLLVMGEEAALALAERERLALLWVSGRPARLRLSPAMRPLIAP